MINSERIATLFAKEKAKVAYLTAGDGGIERTVTAALALIEGGANMLEIGIPFSDPIGDGVIIQAASARALASGTQLEDILYLVQCIRAHSDIPLILFSYLNPILQSVNKQFLPRAQETGVDGLLVVDCPLEESAYLSGLCAQSKIAYIQMLSTSTSLTRVQKIGPSANGFLYYACQQGITGFRQTLPEDFKSKITAIKAIVRLPVVVGFGITQPAMAQQVLSHADGVVIGSLFVQAVAEGASAAALRQLAQNVFQSTK